jgi:pyruvate formate lyase activating enzyme
LVDYIAVDLKTILDRYSALHPGAVASEKLVETLHACRNSTVEVEYRTTCVPGWVDEEVIVKLGKLIEGAPLWALQQFHPEPSLCKTTRDVLPYPPERLQHFADLARRYVQRVILRGL